ncbi:Pex19 protein family-domain-containing protein [Crassisporium funariophilum]|nr:Pex19 protein family-domain-containing protein [Crassisporium funariophilum]
MSASTTRPTLELNNEPDDDLDDLDDVLSQFGPGQKAPPQSLSPIASPPPPPPTATTATTFGRPRTNTRVDAPPASIPGSGTHLDPTSEADEDALSSDFAKELARGMESLMREIAGDPTEGAGEKAETETTEEERARAFKAAWEAMLVEGMDGNVAGGDLNGLGEIYGKDNEAKGKEKSAGGFQDKIKQAMDKLKESETNLQADSSKSGAAGATPTPESLEALLASLGDLGLGEGGEDETELAGFLESMMGQLMSKEVLYEPLKELAEGFPPYLASPPAPLSAEDRKRYDSQLICVRRILAVFEKESYSDSDPEMNKQIVDLMSEMQSYGSPPTEIMGALPPGLDGMGGIPGMSEEGCTIA